MQEENKVKLTKANFLDPRKVKQKDGELEQTRDQIIKNICKGQKNIKLNHLLDLLDFLDMELFKFEFKMFP